MSLDEFQSALDEVLILVPNYVSLIEKKVGSGQGQFKKQFLTRHLVDLVEKRLGRGLTDNEYSKVAGCIDKQVEDVMSTPKKKGDL